MTEQCEASSWKRGKGASGDFGPGGFNRCQRETDHTAPYHRDDWGTEWRMGTSGSFIRPETDPQGDQRERRA